ncbi:hypothetical protein JOF56_006703 [Kibdelosporangium banguiense]|uniref:HEAT repeat domain-containing protein n=1 Tax=Kibdelosporangium banguiense TaxID=1365924 RepID=A0ABS4TQY3_9PSEU|nr:hypothetical protein [Kibdelosporangium banguiense]MBP2326318.1 hypothetical protein [Kibdelosporangium banguiense]
MSEQEAAKAGPAEQQTPEPAEKADDIGKKSSEHVNENEDPFGADRRGFSEFYDRDFFQTDGPMRFVRTPIDHLHIGDVYYAFGRSGTVKSATVREGYLGYICSRYLKVSDYDKMLAMLRDHRLVVLFGYPGSGRQTTAIVLLDALADGKVARFDDEQDAKSLTNDDFTEGWGYVLELDANSGASLTEPMLNKLRDMARGNESWCVVIAELDGHRRDLADYAIRHHPPDKDKLLAAHIDKEIDLDDEDGLEARLIELAGTPRMRKALGSAPQPAEIAEMAKLLVAYGHGQLTLDEVEAAATKAVGRQIEEWFAVLAGTDADNMEGPLRLGAFRIALAVFNESPYTMVVEQGSGLVNQLKSMKSDHGGNTKKLTLFSDDHARILPVCRAELFEGPLPFGSHAIPASQARYCDDRYRAVVLSYVWQNHNNLRDAIAEWLLELSEDGRPEIWVRAARAIGLFCSLDLHNAYVKLILPLLRTPSRADRKAHVAALALDQAARDERIAGALRDRISYWRRSGTERQKLTAAAVLGYHLGAATIDRTLEELRVLGTPSEQSKVFAEDKDLSLVDMASYSLANLLAFGQSRPVLRQLAEWSASDRQSLRTLAWYALGHLIRWRGYDAGPVLISANGLRHVPRSKERWPLLLVLQDEEPDLREQIAGLLRWALRGRKSDHVARTLFGQWVRAAEKNPACMAALVDFVPTLVHDATDADRLGYLITRLRRDWADPLDDKAAVQIEAALRKEAS